MRIKLNCKAIEEGFIPAERIVRIQEADGRVEEVTVSTGNLVGDRLEASEIGRTGDRVLVELPRESASGRWRVWVNRSSVA